MGVGSRPRVTQNTRNRGRRWGEALVRRVGGGGGDADDGGGEILFPTVELQVSCLSVETGATEDRDQHKESEETKTRKEESVSSL